jgi:hypothetical protein
VAKESIQSVLKTNKRMALVILLCMSVGGVYLHAPWYVLIAGFLGWLVVSVLTVWWILNSMPEEAEAMLGSGAKNKLDAPVFKAAESARIIKDEFDRTGATQSIEVMLDGAFGDRADRVFDLHTNEDIKRIIIGFEGIIKEDTEASLLISGVVADIFQMELLEGRTDVYKFTHSISSCIAFIQSDRIVKINESVYQIKEV